MNLPRSMTLFLAVIWLGVMACVLPASAADIPAHIQNELPDARLLGQGDFRWYGLKIYEAKLWSSNTGEPPGAPASGKFILDLGYARGLYGSRIAESSIEEIRKLGLGTPARQSVWLDKMKSLFPDVQEGTHISGVYLPAQGARFYLDGKLLGEIDDPEFARAFFSIWLDERTSAAGLRNQLLNSRS